MRVKVDEDLCIGSGNCEGTCPKLFKVVDGLSQVQADPLPKEEEDCAQEAVNGCPVGAISIT
ncbi:MAG: ferredoxin [Desulfatiglandaceae bacterium]|jgi:ferredoxin